jgi:hypothetical protein
LKVNFRTNIMEKTQFNNKFFYWAIILVVSGLLLKTVYTTFSENQSIGIMPMVLQFVLLILILAKHKLARIGIIVWASLFLLILSIFQITRQLVQNIKYGFDMIFMEYYLLVSINIVVGILILYYTIKTTKIIKEYKTQNS